MGVSTARLLVTATPSDEILAELDRQLPTVPRVVAEPPESGPWPRVEAWLVGSVDRELPRWDPVRTPRLRFVQRLYTGLDDFPFGRIPPGVEVAGNVGGYAPFVAEHAVTLLLALAHDLIGNREKVRTGRLRPPSPNRYVADRTVLLLGYGEIAHEIASRLRPFGARIEGLSRDGSARPGVARMYPAAALRDALPAADFIVDCRPLTRSTRGSIDRAALRGMKRLAVFVNVGRAATVDEASLFEHLRAVPEFRAGLDVWWQEDFERGTLGTRFPFSELPNFLGTPHVAGVGRTALLHAIGTAVANLARFFHGRSPLHLAQREEYVASPPARASGPPSAGPRGGRHSGRRRPAARRRGQR